MTLGAHVSTAGGLPNAISNGEEIGCDAIQIFLKNPNQWAGKSPTDEQVEGFQQAWKASSIQSVLVHDIHLCNLASPKPDVLTKSRHQFSDQMALADRIGIPYIVTHLGSHLGAGEEQGLKTLSDSFNQLFSQHAEGRVKILLETTAGQGSNLGYRFEHLREVIDASEFPHRFGVCFDTCHVFAAGYDLRTDENYRQTFDQFDQIIGLERLLGFHLNDAKSAYESRVDRHDHIGEGNIGELCFRRIVNDSRFVGIPMIIETPKMKEMHGTNLRVLRGLVDGS